jgi:polyisoprenoid-binding protein YceI
MSITAPRPNESPVVERTRWRIDPSRSSVEFEARTLWGRATVRGRFDRFDGTLDLADEPAIKLTIDAASLDTGNKLRDKHLRSRDFFDVESHPQVRFVSDSATLDGERLRVSGRLYAAGKSIPLDLDASLRSDGDELEVDARTEANHREFGMSHGTLGMIPTPSKLVVHGRLVNDAG